MATLLQPVVRSGVTGATTIPAPDAALSGTFTGVVASGPPASYILEGVGSILYTELPKEGDPHLFIWIPSRNILTRCLGVNSDTFLVVEDDVTAVSGDTIYPVYGHLTSWTIVDPMQAGYTLNDGAISATSPPINERIIPYNNTFRLLYPAKVNGTELEITENYG